MVVHSKNAVVSSARRSNVFTIPPGAPFLRTLAEAIVNGQVISGFCPKQHPSQLSTATIYVPTRRAARMLAAEFTQAMGLSAVLMPSIRTLGDGDEDEVFFQSSSDRMLNIAETINPLERQVVLAKLVRAWTTQLSQSTAEFYGKEELVVPASTADAIAMAKSLGDLIDQIATEEVPAKAIRGLMAEDYSEWWKLTLPFLQIVMEAWPQYLEDKGRIDPATARRMLLDARCELIRSTPPQGPIIAAGSTGSIPATARFLKAIAGTQNGAVVLPGLDGYLSSHTWKLLSDNSIDKPPSIETHPQFSLSRLLIMLQTEAEDIKQLGDIGASLSKREQLVSIALMPPEETSKWHEQIQNIEYVERIAAMENISSIVAANEREEALAIALAMRECLTHESKSAALVTPDRNLARRVSSELKRFNIEINDSGGTPLKNTNAAIFMRLCLETFVTAISTNRPINPVTFVSLIKHPLFMLRNDPGTTTSIGLLLEHALIRGQHNKLIPGKLAELAVKAKLFWSDANYASGPVRRITQEDWLSVETLCKRMDEAILTFLAAFAEENGEIKKLSNGLLGLLSELCRDDNLNDHLALAEGGAEIIALLEELGGSLTVELELRSGEFPSVLSTLLGERVLRNSAFTHPRLHILGPLEARLQRYDLMILGGLNEATWPQVHRNDPFLNRPMKAGIGMSAPERRVGLSAHDFQQLIGGETVILSRAQRVDDTPSIPSRWVQRLETILGDEVTKTMHHRGQKYVSWARNLDQSASKLVRIEPPNPKPPVSARPKVLSVTDIETWIRDPYALYARKILALQKLPDLLQTADPATKGSLYHAVLNEFLVSDHNPKVEKPFDHLMRIFDTELSKLGLDDVTALVWRPRFKEIAELFLAWESERKNLVHTSATEISGELSFNLGQFILRARADRIDKLMTGEISVLDYKTGIKPGKREALTLSPQLTLEGAIAKAGGFTNISSAPIASLEYVRLRKAKSLKVDVIAEKNPDEAVNNAKDELENHIKAYQQPEQGYRSRYAVQLENEMGGDYDHLARVREWSLGDEDQGAVDE